MQKQRPLTDKERNKILYLYYWRPDITVKDICGRFERSQTMINKIIEENGIPKRKVRTV